MGSDMQQYLASGNTGLQVLSLSRVTSKRKIVAESEIRLTLKQIATRTISLWAVLCIREC
jgi:hypothetical protein